MSSQHVLITAIWEWHYYVHLVDEGTKVRELEQLVEPDTGREWQSWDSIMGLTIWVYSTLRLCLLVCSLLFSSLGGEVSLFSKAHLPTRDQFLLCILYPPFSTDFLPSACSLIFPRHHLT